MLFGNKLDLNRGILTSQMVAESTNSGSTYVADPLGFHDTVLDAAILPIKSANDKYMKSTQD